MTDACPVRAPRVRVEWPRMPPTARELARRGGLARTQGGEPQGSPAAELEARLRAVLDEVTALDLEIEALSAALAEFSRTWERQLGERFAELAAAERLVRR